MQDKAPRPLFEPGQLVPSSATYEVVDSSGEVVAERSLKRGAFFPDPGGKGRRYRAKQHYVELGTTAKSSAHIEATTQTHATTLRRLAKR
ncbi:MAG: hypothetical protein FJX67_12025 [Alphaproteobacteria bacterium]|nr:hypothetical protein [Alphaproteobacteria bacterium]